MQQLKQEKDKHSHQLRSTLFGLKRQILDSQKNLFEAHLSHLDERSRNYHQWRSEAAKVQDELLQKIEQIELQIEQKNQQAESKKQQNTEELALFKKQIQNQVHALVNEINRTKQA